LDQQSIPVEMVEILPARCVQPPERAVEVRLQVPEMVLLAANQYSQIWVPVAVAAVAFLESVSRRWIEMAATAGQGKVAQQAEAVESLPQVCRGRRAPGV
jgi:hypothetical protein